MKSQPHNGSLRELERRVCPEGTIDNSPAFQRRVGCMAITSPEGTADGWCSRTSSTVTSGLDPCGLLLDAKAPGYSRRVPPGPSDVKTPRRSHAAASRHKTPRHYNRGSDALNCRHILRS